MGERAPHQSQTRAHKKNVGAVQALGKYCEQLQLDQRKSVISIDQEILDAQKFIETVKSSTGYRFTYDEVFPLVSERSAYQALAKSTAHDTYRPTKKSALRTEVALRKRLTEARFRVSSDEFFRRWRETFQINLHLDEWRAGAENEVDHVNVDDDRHEEDVHPMLRAISRSTTAH